MRIANKTNIRPIFDQKQSYGASRSVLARGHDENFTGSISFARTSWNARDENRMVRTSSRGSPWAPGNGSWTSSEIVKQLKFHFLCPCGNTQQERLQWAAPLDRQARRLGRRNRRLQSTRNLKERCIAKQRTRSRISPSGWQAGRNRFGRIWITRSEWYSMGKYSGYWATKSIAMLSHTSPTC